MGKYPWSDREALRREERRPKPVRIAVTPQTLSPKRQKLQIQYVALVQELLAIDPLCEVREDGCQIEATGLHHIEKRNEKNLCDPKNVKRACNSCQTWIEENPLEAIKKGHSKSKHIKAEL